MAALVLLVWNPRELFDPSFQFDVSGRGFDRPAWRFRFSSALRPRIGGPLRGLQWWAWTRALPPKMAQFRIRAALDCHASVDAGR